MVSGFSSPGGYSSDFYVVKINSTGEIIWSKTCSSEMAIAETMVDAKAIETDDGKYIIFGGGTSKENFDYVLIAMKLDSNGNKLFERMYELNLSGPGAITKAHD
ncbi:hypothetical protein [Pseudothermotoga thermarum]|uniref:hypothetical protein n=1 Tax=Pseudothermotoga thermarum TaxID=119394 RepID=UPI00059D750D|nr:hypothetical protein [Pseudothermotoga thermarum]